MPSAIARDAAAFGVKRIDAEDQVFQSERNSRQCGSARFSIAARTRSHSSRVARGVERAAHQLEAQEEQIGVERSRPRSSCGSRRSRRAGSCPTPRCRPCRACPGSPQSCATSSSGAPRAAVEREHVHQVAVALVEAVDVVVVAEVLVVVAGVPEAAPPARRAAGRGHQHRQVEAAAVPRHQLRRVLVDAVEEALDRARLVALGLAEREDLHALVGRAARSEITTTRCRCMRQEVVAGLHAALLRRQLGDVLRRLSVRRQLVQSGGCPATSGSVSMSKTRIGQSRQSGKTPVDR